MVTYIPKTNKWTEHSRCETLLLQRESLVLTHSSSSVEPPVAKRQRQEPETLTSTSASEAMEEGVGQEEAEPAEMQAAEQGEADEVDNVAVTLCSAWFEGSFACRTSGVWFMHSCVNVGNIPYGATFSRSKISRFCRAKHFPKTIFR